MIFDVYGKEIGVSAGGTVVTEASEYDFWTKAKNLSGGYGFINNVQINSDNTLKTSSGYATSGYIPLMNGMKIKIDDVSKVDVASSKIVFYKDDFTLYSRQTLDKFIAGDVISGDVYGGQGVYLCLSLKLSDTDISIVCEHPADLYSIDNEWIRGYWQNVSYNNADYTYSEMEKYVDALGTTYAETYVRQPKPIYLPMPYTESYNKYVVCVSEYPNYSEPLIVERDVYSPYIAITNLKADTIYYYKIDCIGMENGVEVAKTVCQNLFKTSGLVRMISIDGVGNARDIGNKKTATWGKIRQGLLYRSARLDDITQKGLDSLAQLGVTVEIDFRTDDELSESTYIPKLEYYNISTGSFQGIAEEQETAYASMIAIFKKTLEVLKAGKRLIYHCKGGADRTGVISAMFEGVLGVSASDISKDYETTSNYTSSTMRNDLEDDGHHFSEGMLVMEGKEGDTLADKWANFLVGNGVTANEIKEFRQIMLTDYA